MNESNNESEKNEITMNDHLKLTWMHIEDMEKREAQLELRVIALERALEALLKKEEMSKLNLSGGDGEWY